MITVEWMRHKGFGLCLERTNNIGIYGGLVAITKILISIRRKTSHIRSVRNGTTPIYAAALVDICNLTTEIVEFPIDIQRCKYLVITQDIRKYPLYTRVDTRTIAGSHRHTHT